MKLSSSKFEKTHEKRFFEKESSELLRRFKLPSDSVLELLIQRSLKIT